MSKRIVILFPCVGRRVVLVELFRRAVRRLGFEPVIVGTDSSETSPALQCCDRPYVVQPVARTGYANQTVDIVKQERVDLLVPTVDLDLPIWARLRGKLAGLGCTALISTPEVVNICQDKRETFRFLKKHGFDTPDTMDTAEVLALKRRRFPYFLKPWDGHAGRGNAVAHDKAELEFYVSRIPNCLVQEVISGQEITIDVLVDFKGDVRCVVPRERLEVRSGEVSKARTVKNLDIIREAKRLVETLGAMSGIITIQCFLTEGGEIKIIEMNPRFGGGIPLSIKAGASFPRWILQFWLGKKPRIKLDGWRDNLLMLRYDEAVWRQD